MVQLRRGPELAVQPLVASDLPPVVTEDDLPGTDPSGDPQPREPDRQRVLVLADRRQRLAVDPRGRVLGRVERLGRQLPAARPTSWPSASPTVSRRPADRALEILEARGSEPVVELGERGDLGHRHQVGAAEAADLALDAALLVRAFLALRVKLDS